MNITDAKYINSIDTGEKFVISANIDGTAWHIAVDNKKSRFYKEIMKQVDAGTITIADAD